MKLRHKSMAVAISLALCSAAWAQEASEPMDHSEHMNHTGHGTDSSEMDHSQQMDHSMQNGDAADEMDHSEHMDHTGHGTDSGETDHSQHMDNSIQNGDAKEEMDHSEHMDHSGHGTDSGEMDHSEHAGHGAATATAQTESGSESQQLRDPHAYAEGEDFGPLGRPRLADEKSFGAVLIHRLEAVETDENSWWAFDGQAWYGRTYDRANLKLEGEVDSGKVHELRTGLLWSHAIASFWDTQLGIRHDSGDEPDRTWAAFGVQGLAPYWFHVDATLYAGERGDTAALLKAEYDLLFTQRLILQPKVEANLFGQNDEVRGTGSGLSDLSVGFRLRYEVTRQFAPYFGVEWAGLYGKSADFARDEDAPTEETRWVAGVHMWF